MSSVAENRICRTNPVFLALEKIKLKPQSSTESSAAESRQVNLQPSTEHNPDPLNLTLKFTLTLTFNLTLTLLLTNDLDLSLTLPFFPLPLLLFFPLSLY